MAHLSTIDRLKPEVRALIGQLRERGRTIMEIKGELELIGVHATRSALGRHTRRLDMSRPVALAAELDGVSRRLAAIDAKLDRILAWAGP